MSPPPATPEIPLELSRLVHELRQPLSAARLLTDELARVDRSSPAAEQLDLLSLAVSEAIEVAHALDALAARALADDEGEPGRTRGQRPDD